ncbi:MAG TPA: hypothetical protein VMW09_00470 [Desulfatiglandales bacterium]|nr:hypothetical protein [Desulfatiglandales bacterium]
MNNLEFIVRVISALIWPLTLLALILIMRRPIQNLLSTLRLKYGGFEFEIKLREAKSISESIEPVTQDHQELLGIGSGAKNSLNQPVDKAYKRESITYVPARRGDIFSQIFIDDMLELTQQNPNHAIHMAWGAVESRLNEIANAKKIEIQYYSPRNRNFAKLLNSFEPKLSELIIKLNELFDDMNESRYSVGRVQSTEYVDLTLNVIRQLAKYEPRVEKRNKE